MKTVILAGGKGLRYGIEKPKGLALVGGKPIIHHVMSIYSSQGYNDFILILGNGGEKIEEYFAGIKHGYKIVYRNVSERMNKAGSLYLVEKLLIEDEVNEVDSGESRDRNFMCTYADCIADIKLKELLRFHSKSDNIATITAVKPNHEYGIIEFDGGVVDGGMICCGGCCNDEGDKIVKFREKPQMSNWMNAGFFVFNCKIFDYIHCPEDNLETDVFNRLVEAGKIGGYKHYGAWETLNTLKDEVRLNEMYDEGELGWLER